VEIVDEDWRSGNKFCLFEDQSGWV